MHTQEDLRSLRDENFLRYNKQLHLELDITSIILKGHLFVEELLTEILKLHCRDSKPIENIQLSFHHKLKLVQALFGSHLSGFQYPGNIWPVLDHLNQLRNALAHQIDSPKAVIKLNSFISSFCQLVHQEVNVKVTEEIPLVDKSLSNKLINIISSLLGYLGCIHGVAYLNPPSMHHSNTIVKIPDAID
ncbi:hypothetical protein VNX24_16055 [Citrobacter farmeri]|uniref:hypothetical protein n=1 Tax=Citrobacter farmeri TaxID=67824 RepID=UPI0023AF5B07|nr:hypothetical protein [Citrobacter farmeri]MEC3932589.1 hypothetical protein [Citrobacter farmeri]